MNGTLGLFDLPAPKQVADTSREAYRAIAPELPALEALVLDALGQYRDWVLGQGWPTGYELFEFMRRRGLARDINSVRPRLCELSQREPPLVQRGPDKRACRVTGKTAYVWSLRG